MLAKVTLWLRVAGPTPCDRILIFPFGERNGWNRENKCIVRAMPLIQLQKADGDVRCYRTLQC